MSFPDVSIVVIAHNEAHRIATCLDALLAQRTALSFEVVVVDDGSTDGTSEVVAALKDEGGRLRCVRLEANQGRGAARRAGVEAARGRDVGFVDADIVVPPTWLQSLADGLHGAAAVSGIAVPDGDVAPLARIFAARPRVVPGSATITGNNVLFDGAVLRATPMPESRLGEDFRLAERLRSEGHVLRCRLDVVVRHDELKSYRASLQWLFDSGVDATSLLLEFRRIRLPDVIALVWAVIVVTSVVLAWTSSPWLLLAPLLGVVVVAFVHTASRFQVLPRVDRWLATALADVPLVGIYLTGRVVGCFSLRHPASRRRSPA